jgi:hypothetical protein
METQVTMYGPALYELRVRGALDASWIETMHIETIEVIDSAQGAVTVLTGAFQDQAALRGVLDRIYRLNLPLISVRHIDSEP